MRPAGTSGGHADPGPAIPGPGGWHRDGSPARARGGGGVGPVGRGSRNAHLSGHHFVECRGHRYVVGPDRERGYGGHRVFRGVDQQRRAGHDLRVGRGGGGHHVLSPDRPRERGHLHVHRHCDQRRRQRCGVHLGGCCPVHPGRVAVEPGGQRVGRRTGQPHMVATGRQRGGGFDRLPDRATGGRGRVGRPRLQHVVDMDLPSGDRAGSHHLV